MVCLTDHSCCVHDLCKLSAQWQTCLSSQQKEQRYADVNRAAFCPRPLLLKKVIVLLLFILT